MATFPDEARFPLDTSCVTVLPIPPAECECGEGTQTHFVELDMVNNGSTHEVYVGCQSCANDFAERLRESLPLGIAGGPDEDR